MNRSHDIGHVGGGTADHRGISHAQGDLLRRVGELRTQVGWIRVTHLNWEARREAGDALQLPSFRQPGQAVEEPIEGHLPNVADHEVMVHVARGEAATKLGVLEIDQIAKA